MTEPVPPFFQIRLFGSPIVEWSGNILPIQRRNVRGLLYFLAAEAGTVPRDRLCFLFWPDHSDRVARRNLTHLLTHLRQALPDPDCLITAEETIHLDRQIVWCDVVEFRNYHLIESLPVELLQRIINLYRGPFLVGSSFPHLGEYERWVVQERSTLERLYLSALAGMIEQLTTRRNYDQAIRYARDYLKTDDLAENIHRQLIELFALTGERKAALRQYEICVAILERELGVNPLPETRAAYLAVLEERQPITLYVRGATENKYIYLPGKSVPFIGRELIMRQLDTALETARSGSVFFVLIVGEAGIGKSRLLHEFLLKWQGKISTLSGSGYPSGGNIPYQPVVDILRSCLAERRNFGELSPIWLAEVARLLPEIRQSYPDLPITAPADTEDARLRLFEATYHFIFFQSPREQTVVLSLDNLHWVDKITLDWLSHFVRFGIRNNKGVLLVGTARSEEEEVLDELRLGLTHHNVLMEINLEGLGREAVLKLIGNVGGYRPGSEILAERLQLVTGGNPFYILEMMGALVEEEGLDGELKQLDEIPLPPSIQEIVVGRLKHLDGKSRQILETGAVLGDTFDFTWVSQTAGRNELETIDCLDKLVGKHFLIEKSGEYEFHEIIRRAVEAGLSPVRRRLLHRRAGSVLEKLDPTAAATLAFHFEQGNVPAKALHYHILAAKKAETLYAWPDAEKHESIALNIIQHEDPGRANPLYLAQQGRILSGRAHLYFMQGRITDRDADLASLLELAETTHDERLRLQAFHHSARYLNLDGQYNKAINASIQGLTLAKHLKDTAESTQFLSQIGFAHYFLGQPQQAMIALEEALTIAGNQSGPEQYGRVMHILGYVYFHKGDYIRSFECQCKARDCHQQIDDHNRIAWDLIDMGACCMYLGQFDEATRYMNEGLDLARHIVARPPEAYGLYYLGCLALNMGEYNSALLTFKTALSIQGNSPAQHVTIGIEIGIGLSLYHEGNLDDARYWLEPAIERARVLGLRRRLIDGLIGLGLLTIASKQPQIASAHLTEAVMIARDCEYSDGLARAVEALKTLE